MVVQRLMREFIKSIDWLVKVGFLTSIALIVASFILPPAGIIDTSVLKGIGEIDLFTTILAFIYKLPDYIKAGVSAKLTRGSTTIELSGEEHKQD